MSRTSTGRLLLTGERKMGQFLVKLSRRRLWLTTALFRMWCKLTCGLIRTHTGFVSASPATIWLLRRAIDKALGRKGAGKRIIETGSGLEYRLTISKEAVARDPGFCELPLAGLIAPEDVDTLLSLPVVSSDQFANDYRSTFN